MTDIEIEGVDPTALAELLKMGIDHGGNPVEPFIDDDGGWPLRCCLTDSEAGDEIAIIAWSPFPWKGAYAETGPIVVHTHNCRGATTQDRLPPGLDAQPMTLRPYGTDQRIAYDRVRHIPEGDSLTAHVREILDDHRIGMVHGRNVTGGCFSFSARRVHLT